MMHIGVGNREQPHPATDREAVHLLTSENIFYSDWQLRDCFENQATAQWQMTVLVCVGQDGFSCGFCVKHLKTLIRYYCSCFSLIKNLSTGPNVLVTPVILGHTEELPEMTSSSNMSLSPSLKSSSMFSICVPAFRKWELHHAVNVCTRKQTQHK